LGGGRRGGHEGRGIFESVNNNNIIYEETRKLESEKTSSSKPIETGQNALGNWGEAIEAKLKSFCLNSGNLQ